MWAIFCSLFIFSLQADLQRYAIKHFRFIFDIWQIFRSFVIQSINSENGRNIVRENITTLLSVSLSKTPL